MRQYQTVPFNPSTSEANAGKGKIAEMMGQVINQMSAQGWTFQSYEAVMYMINPGCLNFMSGPRPANYGVLVFFRDVAI